MQVAVLVCVKLIEGVKVAGAEDTPRCALGADPMISHFSKDVAQTFQSDNPKRSPLQRDSGFAITFYLFGFSSFQCLPIANAGIRTEKLSSLSSRLPKMAGGESFAVPGAAINFS